MNDLTALQSHEKDYHPEAWQQYTMEELGNWVSLFSKRATHRSDKAKRDKDLYDAQNYLLMMQSKLDEIKAKLWYLQ